MNEIEKVLPLIKQLIKTSQRHVLVAYGARRSKDAPRLEQAALEKLLVALTGDKPTQAQVEDTLGW